MKIDNVRFCVENVGDFHVFDDGHIWFVDGESRIREMYVWEIVESKFRSLYDSFINATEKSQIDLSFEDFERIMQKLKTAYELLD